MKALVCGAGGFIGSHLVKQLKKEGYWVRGIDLKYPEFSKTEADEFIIGDLRDKKICETALIINSINEPQFDEVYQLAADMGGAGFVFSGDNDANIMHNSVQINLNILDLHKYYKKIFYSSSACMYPAYNQEDPDNPKCSEASAYPANPDSEYGWEKLFSERLYLAYNRNFGVDIRIARFHNIFGPEGTWRGGREKSPAALCRKVLTNEESIDIWGDGEQTRSFLYIDECVDGVRTLMKKQYNRPLNIGSEEKISINDLAKMIMSIENKELEIKHIPGPLGVRGRNSDNDLIRDTINWEPKMPLKEGITKTYYWIKKEIENAINSVK